VLLESLIAISVITIVMSAVGVEFVNGTISASRQRATQVAVQLAGSTVDQVRSLAASDLVAGRGSASVTAQFGAAGPLVAPWLEKMDKAVDPTVPATSGPAAALPTGGVVQTVGSVAYTVNQYLGQCSIPTLGASDCVAPSTLGGAGGTPYLRAVVAVTWTGQRCGPTPCAYVASTLVSAAADPGFRATAVAYPRPSVTAPTIPPGQTSQVSVIGDPASTVGLQMKVDDGTGVPPFSWSVAEGALPPGLVILDPATGRIGLDPSNAGVPGPAGTYTAKVQVRDAFLRTDAESVVWTIKPPLTLTAPGAQSTVVNRPASLTLAATDGAGPPYTFSAVSALPPGLTIAASGVISGTPTAVGVYSTRVKVLDKDNTRSDVKDLSWSVTYPPITASSPATQVDTVSTAIRALQLSASGGSGTYAWSDPSATLPAGLSVSSGGVVSGSATALTAGSGAPVVLTVRDPAGGSSTTISFTWSIVAKPSVSAPVASAVLTVGQVISFGLSTTCPNSPCSYAVIDGPPGLSVTSAGVITGTVGGSPATYPTASIVVTDNDGATARSATFSLTVTARPAVSGSAQADTLGGSVSVALAVSCPNAPCSYVLNNGPTGLAVSSSGVITGVVGGTAQTYGSVTVDVTDTGGVQVRSSPFTWVVSSPASVSGLSAKAVGETATPSIPLTYSCPATPCTLTLSGTLATTATGLGLSASPVTVTANTNKTLTLAATTGTVYVNGLVSSTAVVSGTSAAYGVTLTVSDANGFTPASVSTTYTAYSTPTVSTPGPVSTTQSGTPSRSLTYACPSFVSCTVSVTGLPSGVGLTTFSSSSTQSTVSRGVSGNGTLYLSGRVSVNAPDGTFPVTVTTTYSGGPVITSTGIWTVS
jgi:type II secretory pathway pseudopilin PulG